MKTSLLVLTLPLVLIACKPKGPCTGGGMVVDEREVAPTLAEVMGPGGGAVCRAENDTSPNTTDRHYEIPDVGPAEAIEAWAEHMQAKGWHDVTPLARLTENIAAARDGDGCGLVGSLWAKPGVTDRVFINVSFCVDDKGWSTLVLQDCTKQPGLGLCQDL